MWLPEPGKTVALGVVVFVLTMLESFTVSRCRSAELLAYRYRSRRLAWRSAYWSGAFEVILCVWLLVGTEDRWVILLAIPGAMVGQYWSVVRGFQRGTIPPPDEDQGHQEIG